jgi:predicted TIM-barrel fold metal-dependent hydrolase
VVRWLALGALAALACRPGARAVDLQPAKVDAAEIVAHDGAVAEAAQQPPFVPSDIPRIDVHTHVEPGAFPRARELLGRHGTRHFVNLSGGAVGDGLEQMVAEARRVGGVTLFCNPSFEEIEKGPGYGARIAKGIQAAYKAGARGIKISKGLGLGWVDAKGAVVPVDDPGLDPMFELAGRLHMPIAIHTGDPKAFWKPPTPENERYEELSAHPNWSFYGHPMTWEALYAQFERRVKRHPKTIFIGVHFGNDPEDPAHVGRMLDTYKNLYIDLAARVPEIGRVDANHDPTRLRAFFEKYQDRILWGTDVAVGNKPHALMFGSTGREPAGPRDEERFFDGCYRWLETTQKGIPSPTPIQGRWTIDGIGLPREILEKVYWKNAAKLLGITLPAP